MATGRRSRAARATDHGCGTGSRWKPGCRDDRWSLAKFGNGGWEAMGPPGMPSIRDIFIAEDATILAGYYAGVYVFSDSFWVASPINGADQAPRDVSAVIRTSAGTIMAGAAWDSWRRESGSASWQLMTTIDTPWFDVQSFGVLGDRLLGGTRFTGVVESYDDGQTWHRLGTGLIGSEDIRAVQFNLQGVPHISTYGSGIFQLNPWSRSWLPMNTGLDGHLRVTSLAFDSYGNAFAGSLDGGLFRHIIAGVDTEEQVTLPSTLTLGSPYPNPAARHITLPVLSPISGAITFELYDLLGDVSNPLKKPYMVSNTIYESIPAIFIPRFICFECVLGHHRSTVRSP